MTWRNSAVVSGLLLVMAALQPGCRSASGTLTELQRIKAGDLDVVLLSPRTALQHGQETFVLEFRRNGDLVDVGDVRASATMPMPGMPMFGRLQVQPGDAPGRYTAAGEFQMAGTWRLTLEWMDVPDTARSLFHERCSEHLAQPVIALTANRRAG